MGDEKKVEVQKPKEAPKVEPKEAPKDKPAHVE
jgi:hypothetical protein